MPSHTKALCVFFLGTRIYLPPLPPEASEWTVLLESAESAVISVNWSFIDFFGSWQETFFTKTPFLSLKPFNFLSEHFLEFCFYHFVCVQTCWHIYWVSSWNIANVLTHFCTLDQSQHLSWMLMFLTSETESNVDCTLLFYKWSQSTFLHWLVFIFLLIQHVWGGTSCLKLAIIHKDTSASFLRAWSSTFRCLHAVLQTA